MFMKNVEFENENVKDEYKQIINDHPAVSGVILSLIQDRSGIKISDIIPDENGIKMNILKNNELYSIDIDFYKKKIYFSTPDKTYKLIYNDLVRKKAPPIGRIYQNDSRIITELFLVRFSDDHGHVRYFELKENETHYIMVIESDNDQIMEEYFISSILNSNVKYNTIRNLFLVITDSVKLSDLNIKIADTKNSSIVIENGKINTYIEYQEKDDQYQKIFLENGEFFIEKKVIGEYRDEVTSYIKKLGEFNGKEKR